MTGLLESLKVDLGAAEGLRCQDVPKKQQARRSSSKFPSGSVTEADIGIIRCLRVNSNEALCWFLGCPAASCERLVLLIEGPPE